jgi:hypothetical protein
VAPRRGAGGGAGAGAGAGARCAGAGAGRLTGRVGAGAVGAGAGARTRAGAAGAVGFGAGRAGRVNAASRAAGLRSRRWRAGCDGERALARSFGAGGAGEAARAVGPGELTCGRTIGAWPASLGYTAPATISPAVAPPAMPAPASTAHAMRAMPAGCCATSASSPNSDPAPILTPTRRAHEDAERMYAHGPERISPTAGRSVGGG